jgi:hypothetical protein
MKLYHGTNENVLPQILLKGLRPRGRRKSQWEKYPSRADMVYLTVAYPFYFAMNTKGSGRAMVLEIESNELNDELFFPDEDFIVQGLARKSKSIEKIHDDIRDRLEEYQQHWKQSIEKLGNGCYKGSIPKAAIKRVCFFKPEARPFVAHWMCDPAITITNYHFYHAKYTGLVAWMFGDSAELPHDPDNDALAKLDLSQLTDDPLLLAQIESIKNQPKQRKKESKDRSGIEVVQF